jgi:hypothetical protein
MLPILEGSTRNTFSLTTSGGKKKYAMSYSFHLDTGDMAHKAGEQIQQAAEKGYAGVSKYVRRKYRTMKVKKTLNNMRKSLSRKIKLDLPIDLRSLKSRMREAVS